jgi:hypothetical protein
VIPPLAASTMVTRVQWPPIDSGLGATDGCDKRRARGARPGSGDRSTRATSPVAGYEELADPAAELPDDADGPTSTQQPMGMAGSRSLPSGAGSVAAGPSERAVRVRYLGWKAGGSGTPYRGVA